MSGGQDGSDTGTFFRIYDANGVATTGDVQANTFTNGDQRFADVAVLTDGSFVVVWDSPTPTSGFTDIFGQRFDAAGARIGGEFQINTLTANNQQFADVNPLPDGGFVVSWLYGTIGQIKSQRFDASGIALGVEFEVNQTLVNTTPIAQVAVATLADGSFVAAWPAGNVDGSSDAVLSRRFEAPPNGFAGNEDAPIALPITAALTDTDGSETLTIRLAGLPAGSTLSTGTAPQPDGSFVLGAAQLPGLSFTPPANYNGTFTLTITATATDTALLSGGLASDTATATRTLTVTVRPLNDAPDLTPDNPAAVTYTENTAAVQLLPAAAIADPDNPASFAGGTITATIGGAVSGDRFSFLTPGPDNVQIGLVGPQFHITVGGIDVGTVTGHGSANVSIALNANATDAAAEAIVRALVFDTTSDNPTSAPRTAVITFSDGGNNGGGALSDSVSVPIAVVSVNDVQVALPIAATVSEDGPSVTLDAAWTDPDGGVDGSSFSPLPGTVGDIVQTDAFTVTYDPNGHFEYLAAGETATDTFAYTLYDTVNGVTSTSTATVTITGANDAPVLADGTQAGSTEAANNSADEANNASHQSVGIISFTDVDLSDGHTVSVTPAGGGYRGTLTATIADASTGDGSGAVSWSFEVGDSALDDLAAGQTLTQTYTIAIDDGHGGTDTRRR